MPTSAIGTLRAGNANRIWTSITFSLSVVSEKCKAESEGDADQPAGDCHDHALDREDASHVAGVTADATQDADLADPLEHGHRDRVDQSDQADRDDYQPEHGHHRCDRAVAGDVRGRGDVLDLGRELQPVSCERILEPRVCGIDQVVAPASSIRVCVDAPACGGRITEIAKSNLLGASAERS